MLSAVLAQIVPKYLRLQSVSRDGDQGIKEALKLVFSGKLAVGNGL